MPVVSARFRATISKMTTINLYIFREIGNIGRRLRWPPEDVAPSRGKKGNRKVLGQASSASGAEAPGDRGAGEGPGRRVLIVEDDALICIDTADALEQQGYVVHTALSGEVADVAAVAKAYRVYYRKVPLESGDYTMDHTAIVYLMDKEGRFVSPFNMKRTAELAAADLRKHL